MARLRAGGVGVARGAFWVMNKSYSREGLPLESILLLIADVDVDVDVDIDPDFLPT